MTWAFSGLRHSIGTGTEHGKRCSDPGRKRPSRCNGGWEPRPLHHNTSGLAQTPHMLASTLASVEDGARSRFTMVASLSTRSHSLQRRSWQFDLNQLASAPQRLCSHRAAELKPGDTRCATATPTASANRSCRWTPRNRMLAALFVTLRLCAIHLGRDVLAPAAIASRKVCSPRTVDTCQFQAVQRGPGGQPTMDLAANHGLAFHGVRGTLDSTDLARGPGHSAPRTVVCGRVTWFVHTSLGPGYSCSDTHHVPEADISIGLMFFLVALRAVLRMIPHSGHTSR
jgi:hypothetical protein